MLSSNGFSITLISMPSIVVMSIRGENFHFSIVIDMHISERCNSRRGSNVYVSSIIVIFAVFCNCRRYSLVDCGNIGGHVYVHYRFSIRWRSLCCVSYSQVLRYTTMTFDLLIVIHLRFSIIVLYQDVGVVQIIIECLSVCVLDASG